MNENALQHWGIKGMKWGVRRYQNEDGSLTDLGKKRMYRELFDNEGKDPNEKKKYVADANRWDTEDKERSKKLVDESTGLARNSKNLSDSIGRIANKKKAMDLSSMTDKDMREQINRALLERQYKDLFAEPTNVSKGTEYVSKTLDVAGNALAVTASALGIALAIKQLKG
jgi:hypothetical protein